MHRRHNPAGITQYNIVPGMLGVILQLTMVMMTTMALTRETWRGTKENLLAMPATPLEIMLGKILPRPVVGAVQVVVVLVAARADFGIPFVARTQMQAMQLTFFFLRSLLLSGFMFPYRGMPGRTQALREIFPLTHFLRLIGSVTLKGADAFTVSGSFAALGLFGPLLSAAALLRFRRTLD